MITSYKIIASDAKEYGPVTLEELQAWILDGRVGSETKVWKSDTEQWLEASALMEVQFELGRASQIFQAAPSLPAVGEGSPERLVGFWSRLGAYFLDHILLAVIAMFIFPAPPELKPSMMGDWQNPIVRKLLMQQGSLEVIYYLIMTAAYGATLGKFAIGARIVRADGRRLGVKLAALRILAAALSILLTVFFGYLLILFRRDKRALHDIFLGTKVIYKKS